MQVEDHPIEYNKFEGIIPDGEYGGGTVMIWDAGHWTPEPADVDAALKRGELKFRLEGKKLRGSWVLVRTRGRPGDSKPAWLLIKHRDEWTSTEEVTELAPARSCRTASWSRSRATKGKRPEGGGRRPMPRCCARY